MGITCMTKRSALQCDEHLTAYARGTTQLENIVLKFPHV